jgi:alpha-L-rhamnosidase
MASHVDETSAALVGLDDATVVVTQLRTADDSGLPATGTATPRLSWRLASDRPGVRHMGYELQVADEPTFDADTATTSGVVASSRHLHAAWPAPPLCSRQVRWWRVRVRTDRGMTAWSEPARVEAALLEAADWVARPVTLGSDAGRSTAGPVPLLRRDFDLNVAVASARLYVTALGVHAVAINGLPVSDELLEPGWQSYHHRVLYASYDVTGLLTQGRNVLSAAVGDGWYRGKLTWTERHNVYGDSSGLLAQLEMRLVDGRTVTVATDRQWRAATGALRAADLYDGTDVDLRLQQDGWQLPGFDDSSWEPVTQLDMPVRLEQRTMPPVRVVETRHATPEPNADGNLLVDSGQNLTGYLRVRVSGAAGCTVTVRHAEVLDGEGGLHTAALRTARATDTYILADDRPVVLEPAFTFHGFRYAEITTSPDVTVESVEIAVVTSDLAMTGEFECSDERVNQLFRNITWSQRSNFLSIPTDCPQRDERLGWTGDIMVFAPTACANADSRAFLANWLVDLALDQRADGAVPAVVPNVLDTLRGTKSETFEYGSTGWGDAATVVPWTLYEAYADLDVLRRQYPSMTAWVDWCASRRGDDGTWTGDWHFGDWLDPGAPPDEPEKATTSSDLIATAYLSHSAGILARTADLLDDDEAAASYAALRDETAAAAWGKWGDRVVTTQAGCAIALQLGIVPRTHRQRIADALAQLVRANDGRVATGFLGTPLVLPALTNGGHLQEAYQLLLNTASPGWLYQVLHGATTTWERWDAIQPDGSIHAGDMAADEGGMLSFNHYAYGAVAEWLYRSVGGLAPDPDDPGYATVVMAPVPGGGLSHAHARIQTPYGPAATSWTLTDGVLRFALEVPPGARGRFVLPPGTWQADHDGRPVDVNRLPTSDGHARPVLDLPSGQHQILLTAIAGLT